LNVAKNVCTWRIFGTIQWNLLADTTTHMSPLAGQTAISAFGSAAWRSSRRIPKMSGMWHIDSEATGLRKRCVSSGGFEDTMLQTPRPTPTCTRFQASIEMPCIKCAEPMRLALIEPRRRYIDLLTYHCVRCDSDESFLTAR
jgi:hypothetical protein